MNWGEMGKMRAMSQQFIKIESLHDPRIAPFLNLKERELAREGGRFIAEGELVVKRLLSSEFEVESVLLAPRRVEEIERLVKEGVPIYVGAAEMVNRIVGFKFHSGVMACGVRGQRLTLEEAAKGWADKPLTLVVCPEVSNTDNMGSLIRISSAFGADAMILGEHSCDPYYRQSIRVSMGAVFRLPMVQSEDLMSDLRRLREQWGVELLATVLDERAEELAGARRGRRVAILFGNEAQGLRREHVEACDRKITIPMKPGTDSLNVSVAAGIVMYHFTQYAAEKGQGVRR